MKKINEGKFIKRLFRAEVKGDEVGDGEENKIKHDSVKKLQSLSIREFWFSGERNSRLR